MSGIDITAHRAGSNSLLDLLFCMSGEHILTVTAAIKKAACPIVVFIANQPQNCSTYGDISDAGPPPDALTLAIAVSLIVHIKEEIVADRPATRTTTSDIFNIGLLV